MIEVNLYAVSPADPYPMVGRCVSRSRINPESMGISILEFVKGFLQNELEKFETQLGSHEINELINSDTLIGAKDFASINYFLHRSGYKVQIQNVADDEENPTGVPSGEVVEWNVIDNTFLQKDYPTATKITPADGADVPVILRQIITNLGFFDQNKFAGVKNPFTELLNLMDRQKKTIGSISPAVAARVYELLRQIGVEIFCATSEN